MSKVLKLDKEVIKDFITHMVEGDEHLYFDPENSQDVEGLEKIINGTFQYIGKVLGEAKSEDEETVLEIAGEVEFKVTHREGNGGSSNWGIGCRILDSLADRAGVELDQE